MVIVLDRLVIEFANDEGSMHLLIQLGIVASVLIALWLMLKSRHGHKRSILRRLLDILLPILVLGTLPVLTLTTGGTVFI